MTAVSKGSPSGHTVSVPWVSLGVNLPVSRRLNLEQSCSNLSLWMNHLEILLNADYDSVGLGWGQGTCFSHKLSGEAQKGAKELCLSTLHCATLCSSEQKLSICKLYLVHKWVVFTPKNVYKF